jgi:hypothetical protein
MGCRIWWWQRSLHVPRWELLEQPNIESQGKDRDAMKFIPFGKGTMHSHNCYFQNTAFTYTNMQQ